MRRILSKLSIFEFIGRAELDPTTALPNSYYWVGNEVRFSKPISAFSRFF
jgi:hypothetical protein